LINHDLLMTLGQLRTFLAVVEGGSVRVAAERLVVTQSAVSAALAALQSELGVALVTREGRGLRLTDAGEVFAERLRPVLGSLDEAVAAAQSAADPRRGRLRLAAVTSAGEHLAPSLLASFLDLHPGAEVSLEVGNRRRVWDLLANHQADLVIGGRPPASADTLATRRHQLVVVSARPGATLPPAGRRSAVRTVTMAHLVSAAWLLREPGSGTRAAAEELFDELGLSPRILTIGSNPAIVESVRIGLGITLISRDAVADALAGGTLEEWRYGPLPLERAWHLVGRANEPLSAASRLFLDHLVTSGWKRP
jgi:LysR family transcriptional regulator, low CO2-responsive transcriptional regulator